MIIGLFQEVPNSIIQMPWSAKGSNVSIVKRRPRSLDTPAFNQIHEPGASSAGAINESKY